MKRKFRVGDGVYNFTPSHARKCERAFVQCISEDGIVIKYIKDGVKEYVKNERLDYIEQFFLTGDDRRFSND